MTTPGELTGHGANLQRGELLRDQGRYAEAEDYLQQAIAQSPSDSGGYYELAFCYCNWTGHSKKGLETIDRAIALDPNQAEYFSLRAWILTNLGKHKQAVEVAGQALELNAFSILGLNARTRAHIALADWKQAESSARETLGLAARNETAASLLAVALRQQGRLEESGAVTARLLSQVPDNSMAQANAGWSALQAGDHRRANEFFLEALRLDPNYDYAREGLLHSFSSRVWIYRLYFQWIAWLSKHRKGMRYAFLAMIYVGYRFAFTELRTQFGPEGLHWGMVLVAFYLVIFGFGKSFGNLFLLLDPFARHALTRKEKLFSLIPGAIYLLILIPLILEGAWLQVSILIGIVLFFLWAVIAPQFRSSEPTGTDPAGA